MFIHYNFYDSIIYGSDVSILLCIKDIKDAPWLNSSQRYSEQLSSEYNKSSVQDECVNWRFSLYKRCVFVYLAKSATLV